MFICLKIKALIHVCKVSLALSLYDFILLLYDFINEVLFFYGLLHS